MKFKMNSFLQFFLFVAHMVLEPMAWIKKSFSEYTVEGMRGVFETPSSRARESTPLIVEEAQAADESGHQVWWPEP